jgi:hypothetical protein
VKEISLKPRSIGSFLIIIVVFSSVFIFCSAKISTVNAYDPSQREWISLEILTFSKDNTIIELDAVTSGNNLNQSMWVVEPPSGDLDPQSSASAQTSIRILTSVSVTIGRFIVQAVYSADTNTTTFTYLLSPSQYITQEEGSFPNDKLIISILISTNFNVTFDPRPKFCVTPNSNYYGSYNTTSITPTNPSPGEQYYSVNLEIQHPSSFPGYANTVFILPISLLTILILSCIAIAFYIGLTRRTILDKFYNSFITICSAVIVFIPIFQLSTQELVMPNLFTGFDWDFLVLLIVYITFLVSLLVVKAHGKGSNKEKAAAIRRK